MEMIVVKSIFDKLEKWREDRNLNSVEFDLNVYTANILEEIAEYLRAKDDYERVDALCDICVFSINAMSKFEYYHEDKDIYGWYSIVSHDDIGLSDNPFGNIIITHISYLNNDSYNTSSEPKVIYYQTLKTIALCLDELIIMGYNFEKCMLETIKEISSRRQDPQQASDWLVNGISGKWQKDKNQDPQTLYKADYERCKR
jgi:hypothetical protein